MPTSDYVCVEASFGVVVYKGVAMNMHATAAHDWCQADGANVHLPTPRSQEENDLYNSVFASLNENAFWLGINDAESEGRDSRTQGSTVDPSV